MRVLAGKQSLPAQEPSGPKLNRPSPGAEAVMHLQQGGHCLMGHRRGASPSLLTPAALALHRSSLLKGIAVCDIELTHMISRVHEVGFLCEAVG